MKDEVFIDYPLEIEPELDYETARNKPMPNRLHGTLQSQITFLLRSKYGDRYDFPTEVSLDLKPGATPDICIYPRKASFDRFDTPAKEPEMPITTIEIISPSQSLEDMAKKIHKTYFANGVRSAWIVVPAFKAVHLMLPDDKNLYFSSGLLTDPATGIEISVEKIFERIV